MNGSIYSSPFPKLNPNVRYKTVFERIGFEVNYENKNNSANINSKTNALTASERRRRRSRRREEHLLKNKSSKSTPNISSTYKHNNHESDAEYSKNEIGNTSLESAQLNSMQPHANRNVSNKNSMLMNNNSTPTIIISNHHNDSNDNVAKNTHLNYNSRAMPLSNNQNNISSPISRDVSFFNFENTNNKDSIDTANFAPQLQDTEDTVVVEENANPVVTSNKNDHYDNISSTSFANHTNELTKVHSESSAYNRIITSDKNGKDSYYNSEMSSQNADDEDEDDFYSVELNSSQIVQESKNESISMSSQHSNAEILNDGLSRKSTGSNNGKNIDDKSNHFNMDAYDINGTTTETVSPALNLSAVPVSSSTTPSDVEIDLHVNRGRDFNTEIDAEIPSSNHSNVFDNGMNFVAKNENIELNSMSNSDLELNVDAQAKVEKDDYRVLYDGYSIREGTNASDETTSTHHKSKESNTGDVITMKKQDEFDFNDTHNVAKESVDSVKEKNSSPIEKGLGLTFPSSTSVPTPACSNESDGKPEAHTILVDDLQMNALQISTPVETQSSQFQYEGITTPIVKQDISTPIVKQDTNIDYSITTPLQNSSLSTKKLVKESDSSSSVNSTPIPARNRKREINGSMRRHNNSNANANHMSPVVMASRKNEVEKLIEQLDDVPYAKKEEDLLSIGKKNNGNNRNNAFGGGHVDSDKFKKSSFYLSGLSINDQERVKLSLASGEDAPGLPHSHTTQSIIQKYHTTSTNIAENADADDTENKHNASEFKYPTGEGPCRECHLEVSKKPIFATELSGQWHRQCFHCSRCDARFDKLHQCYVIDDEPVCQLHYHLQNESICKICSRFIEGQCLENDEQDKFHVDCLTCHICHTSIVDDCVLFDSRVPLCRRHDVDDLVQQGIIRFDTTPAYL